MEIPDKKSGARYDEDLNYQLQESTCNPESHGRHQFLAGLLKNMRQVPNELELSRSE